MPHIPVLLKETLEYLDPKPGENFVDCTLGGAGHALAILEKNKPDGKVLGIDLDLENIKEIELRIKPARNASHSDASGNQELENRLILVQDSFVNLKSIVEEYNFKPINGILFDLGMSSWHLDESGRGFSFRKDEPLIMSYAHNEKSKSKNQKSKIQIKNQKLTAEEIINKWPQEELEKIFREYGEERFARRIAGRICEERKKESIKTTFQLVEIVRRSFPRKYKFGKIHCATRIFQALRIAVNGELENLKKVLPQAIEVLEPKGRIVVISFHSLEDRIVKNFFREEEKKEKIKIITKKPIKTNWQEIKKNKRARSSKLRATEKA